MSSSAKSSDSSKSSKAAPKQDTKKVAVYSAIIVACLGAGGLAYYLQTNSAPKPTAEVNQAAQKQEEIQKTMQAQQPKPPAQPTPATGGDFERKVTRGAVTPK